MRHTNSPPLTLLSDKHVRLATEIGHVGAQCPAMTCRDGCVRTLDAHAVLGSTSRLTALPSRSSATSNSQEACMFIENRGVVPKQRDSRRAVSAVMPRFSLTMSLMGVAGTAAPGPTGAPTCREETGTLRGGFLPGEWRIACPQAILPQRQPGKLLLIR